MTQLDSAMRGCREVWPGEREVEGKGLAKTVRENMAGESNERERTVTGDTDFASTAYGDIEVEFAAGAGAGDGNGVEDDGGDEFEAGDAELAVWDWRETFECGGNDVWVTEGKKESGNAAYSAGVRERLLGILSSPMKGRECENKSTVAA